MSIRPFRSNSFFWHCNGKREQHVSYTTAAANNLLLTLAQIKKDFSGTIFCGMFFKYIHTNGSEVQLKFRE